MDMLKNSNQERKGDKEDSNSCDFESKAVTTKGRGRLTSEYLILSSYMYWGPGAFFPMFSYLVSSLTKIFEPSHLFAWVKLNWAEVFSTERGNFPKDVCACSESKACASAVKSVKEVNVVKNMCNKRQLLCFVLPTIGHLMQWHTWLYEVCLGKTQQLEVVHTCEGERLSLLLLIGVLFGHRYYFS